MQWFKYLDAVVLAVLSTVLGSMLFARRKNGHTLRSISATVATDKRTSLGFSILMSICYPLYYAWLWLWVGPKFDMPTAYYVVLAVAALFELVFVWVPSTTGWKCRIHRFSATVVGVGAFILPGLLLLGSQPLSVVGVISVVIFYAVTATLCMLVIIPKYRKNTYTYEVIFCTTFLLVASIVGHS